MIATHNQQNPKDSLTPGLTSEIASLSSLQENEESLPKVKSLSSPSPIRIRAHHPKAGLNPLVDKAAYLFSVLGKLKYLSSYRQLSKLQKELIQEINTFQEAIKDQNYHSDYLMVCRYVLCATFDDIIANTAWGGQGQWNSHCLLTAFNQDVQHEDKFFIILERAIKEPALYIDLMELMYICLSMGYKGQYRSTEHSQYQLEQITNSLYKHIRAFRGSLNKNLSPSFKTSKAKNGHQRHHASPLFIFFVTACIMMTIFVSLGYLMEVISNEAYKNIAQIKVQDFHEVPGQ